jgi:hypothetical protein
LPRQRLQYDDDENDDTGCFADDWRYQHQYQRRRLARQTEPRRPSGGRTKLGRSPRTSADQAFKCGRCRAFIGAPIAGGRHRNHCPMCLYSRHVDGKRPGDRLSDCGSLMAPVGVIQRRNGEQLILQHCLGCGHERPNRVAADDNPTLLLRLPPVQPSQPSAEAPPSEGDEAVA